MSRAIILAVAFLAACGGAQKVPVTTNSQVAPAAQGELKIKTTENGNTEVNLKVKHLADPSKLQEGGDSYVVWARPPGGGEAQNIGALQVDKNLNGAIVTSTPLREFQLFVTPEATPTASSPSGPEVLSSHVRPD